MVQSAIITSAIAEVVSSILVKSGFFISYFLFLILFIFTLFLFLLILLLTESIRANSTNGWRVIKVLNLASRKTQERWEDHYNDHRQNANVARWGPSAITEITHGNRTDAVRNIYCYPQGLQITAQSKKDEQHAEMK